MSGYKYSQIRLEEQRQQKLKLLERVAEAQHQIAGVQQELQGLLAGLSPGFKSSFAAEVARAEAWKNRHFPLPEVTLESDLKEIEAHLEVSRQNLQHGKNLMERLVQVIHQEAPAREQSLRQQAAELGARLRGAHDLLSRWFPEFAREAQGQHLEAVEALSRQDYEQAGRHLQQLAAALETKLRESQELQAQHERRLYVLAGLRQICRDLGMAEVAPPEHERPGDLRSDIVLIIDTYDEGEIKFFLGLEGIKSHSQIREDFCLEEFDKLSEALLNEYGIQTRFEVVGDRGPERLRRKGEQDLPAPEVSRVQKR